MPTYRFIDYNELSSKPADVDMFAIYDIDADELKKYSYASLKSFFVKTDEATDIEAILEFQSTVTKPNSILKFGSAGEFQVYSDGTDLFIKGTTSAGKLRFYTNSTEMMTLNPSNSSIAIKGNALNNTGAAGKGLIFTAGTDRATFTEQLNLEGLLVAEAGIKTLLTNISYSGAASTGLEFDTSSNATFNQELNVKGIINADETGGHSIKADGTIRAESGYYYAGYQGETDTGMDIVNDIRWNGTILQYRKGTAVCRGGIITNWTEGPIWITVP